MKKFFIIWCAVIAFAIIMGMCACASAEYYPLTTIVIEVNYINNIVVCIDFNGNEWVFEDCKDWFVGDICSMIMNDIDTNIIYDDCIVIARYDGWDKKTCE